MRNLLPLLLSLGFVLFSFAVPAAAAEIKKAPDNCKNAHAILGWSDFKKIKGKHGKDEKGNWVDETDEEFQERTQKPWVKVGWIVGRLNWGRSKGNELLQMVDRYQEGKVQQAEFKEYKVKGNDNAKAYVAHCGHGGTCNMIAARFLNLYKGIGVPRVYCVARNNLPKVLASASKPTIPLPSDEELAEPEDDLGDMDDLFGDDDDDDDLADDDDEDF
ncbi:MAG: hypothetical protein AAGA56_30130 [Myxococcota bacterium]